MKLRIYEGVGDKDVYFTPSIQLETDMQPKENTQDAFGIELPVNNGDPDAIIADEVDTIDASIYEDLETLGFVFMFASNDIHTIHINACGENFKELHETADELYKLLNDYSDQCLEICCEDGHYIHSLNDAKDIVEWDFCDCSEKPFTIKEGTQAIIDILNNVVVAVTELYNDVPSDIQSTMDEWIRTLDSKMNYFLGRVVEVNHIFATNESVMSQYITRKRNRKGMFCEHLDKLKLGQSYTMFCQVEDHIDDYNCDPLTLKKGDYIIRDFQFGHLPNGGNKGYIPYEVTDIVYDDVSDKNGYYDRRTRLELDDGKEYFYIVCQNGRFNGMFHKLKKSSIQK